MYGDNFFTTLLMSLCFLQSENKSSIIFLGQSRFAKFPDFFLKIEKLHFLCLYKPWPPVRHDPLPIFTQLLLRQAFWGYYIALLPFSKLHYAFGWYCVSSSKYKKGLCVQGAPYQNSVNPSKEYDIVSCVCVWCGGVISKIKAPHDDHYYISPARSGSPYFVSQIHPEHFSFQWHLLKSGAAVAR